MSQRYLLPADILRADYSNQTLFLYAKGICQGKTTNIHFERLPATPERHAFELVGCRENGIGFEQPYECDRPPFPLPIHPGEYVIIRTANGEPNVPVTYHDRLQKPVEGLLTSEARLIQGNVMPVVLPRVEKRTVLLGEEFEIEAPAFASEDGFVHLAKCPAHLALHKAGIEGGSLLWTLRGIRVGTSEAVVTVSGGDEKWKPPHYAAHYAITVLPTFDAAAPIAAAQASFKARVNDALATIRATAAGATLLKADWSPVWPGRPARGLTEPSILTVTGVAKHPRTDDLGSVSVTSAVGEPWTPPAFDDPIVGLDDVVVANEGFLDADEALDALRTAGYRQAITALSLMRPNLPLAKEQPHYFVRLDNGQTVRVGATDGAVET